jgi:hypothetical protein
MVREEMDDRSISLAALSFWPAVHGPKSCVVQSSKECFMRKMLSNRVFFLSPSIHERGFCVAAFHFEASKPALDKRPGLPIDSAPMALPQGRKS